MKERIKSEFIKLNEINFATKLKYEDIIAIAELYIKSKGDPKAGPYEIDTESILYETNSHIINEPVWSVPVIPKKIKGRFSDGYEYLSISDREGRVVYVQNDHGVVVKMYRN